MLRLADVWDTAFGLMTIILLWHGLYPTTFLKTFLSRLCSSLSVLISPFHLHTVATTTSQRTPPLHPPAPLPLTLEPCGWESWQYMQQGRRRGAHDFLCGVRICGFNQPPSSLCFALTRPHALSPSSLPFYSSSMRIPWR